MMMMTPRRQHAICSSIGLASWTSFFPFSLLASAGSGISNGVGSLAPSAAAREPRIVFDEHLDAYQSSGAFGFGNDYSDQQRHQLDYGALERSIHLISPTDSVFKQALLAFFRQLIMLINSMLGE
jgi:hypothetical protein